jgi:hypothetical protein
VKKKLMMFVILPVAAIASLGIGFLAAVLLSPDVPIEPNAPTQQEVLAQQAEIGLSPTKTTSASPEQTRPTRRGMSNKEIAELSQRLLISIDAYKDKHQAVIDKEKGLTETQAIIKEDLKRLDDMRIEIATAVNALKEQKLALEALSIAITKKETKNLTTLAKTYAGMEPEIACDLFVEKCPVTTDPNQPGNGDIDDVTKILYLMKDKEQSEILNSLVAKDVQLAAEITRRLKHIVIE